MSYLALGALQIWTPWENCYILLGRVYSRGVENGSMINIKGNDERNLLCPSLAMTDRLNGSQL